MSGTRMHVGEIAITRALVRELVSEQFPEWAGLPVERVASPGTDNAVFRLDGKYSLRFPRIAGAADQVLLEDVWLPRLAPNLPCEVPVPLAVGEPGRSYPWRWSVHEWIDGASIIDEPSTSAASMLRLGEDLASFVCALQAASAPDAPQSGRGTPLRDRYKDVETIFPSLGELVDLAQLETAWRRAMRAPDWHRAPVLVHGDLLPGNVLMREDRLAAIIDFAAFGLGDPACDYMMAWATLDANGRQRFRQRSGVDDATWERARGHAIGQAAQFIPYYRESNSQGVERALRSLRAAVADASS